MLLKKKDEIIAWLDKYEVQNYTLRADEKYGYVVDVAAYVYLANQNLTKIPIKFGIVIGDFICSNNQLTSLEGCPKEVQKDFWCQENQLTSLEGSPQHVGKNFYCNNNKLSSLKGAPHSVGGYFSCNYNQLTSLEGSPQHVARNFYCNSNKLTSLQGAPHSVGRFFSCSHNPDLGDLQDINDFKDIQAYLLSQKLAMELSQDLDNHKKTNKIKL